MGDNRYFYLFIYTIGGPNIFYIPYIIISGLISLRGIISLNADHQLPIEADETIRDREGIRDICSFDVRRGESFRIGLVCGGDESVF